MQRSHCALFLYAGNLVSKKHKKYEEVSVILYTKQDFRLRAALATSAVRHAQPLETRALSTRAA